MIGRRGRPARSTAGALSLLLAACGTSKPGEPADGGASAGDGGAVTAGSGGRAGHSAGAGGHSAGAGGHGAGASGGLASAGAPSVPRAPNGYVVDGNRLLDAAGQAVRWRGVALPSLIWDAAGEVISQRDFELMVAWNVGVVRIGLNQGFWLDGGAGCDAVCYRSRVGEVVSFARSAGLDVVLDLHWATANGAVEPQFMPMPDADSVTFWRDVAARYKADGRVLFELYNEPHDVDWQVWKEGGSVTGLYDPDTSDTNYARTESITYQATGMQALYDAIRAEGAENVVIAGGLDWAFDLSGVLAFGLDGHNLVYATHLYPFAGKLADAWPSAFGLLSEQLPVIVSEFGPAAPGEPSCPPDYGGEVLAYADQHRLHWIAWNWFASGSPTAAEPRCESAFFFAEADPLAPVYAVSPFGELVRAALAE